MDENHDIYPQGQPRGRVAVKVSYDPNEFSPVVDTGVLGLSAEEGGSGVDTLLRGDTDEKELHSGMVEHVGILDASALPGGTVPDIKEVVDSWRLG